MIELFRVLIKRNCSLKKINLAYNNIGHKGFKILMESLKKNETLKEIEVEGNKMGYLDSKLIFDSIKKNKQICRIKYNQIFSDQVEIILQCNLDWSPSLHSSFLSLFRFSVFCFLVCVKKTFHFRIPKFVLFEIIKKIDRKSYYKLSY